MKPQVIPSIFTAINNFSGPMEKMSKSMGQFEKAAGTASDKAAKKMNAIGTAAASVAVATGAAGLAIAAPLIYATNKAIDFEDKMADVAKVANVQLGSDTFIKLGDDAKRLGVFLGIGAIEAAGLMQNLAQGGVSIDDLDKVSRIAGKVGVAFGISGDMAGEAFVKTKNALGGTIETTEKLMDAINYLGNTMAASSPQILTFMAAGGSSAARAANAQGEAVAAMGAQLIAMGKSAEESATIVERFVKKALTVAPLRKTFDAAGGGAAGMMAIIEKGSKMSGKAQDDYFQQFGEYGLAVQLLGKNFGDLEKVMGNVTNTTLTADSVLNEFGNRTGTTAFKLAQSKAQFEELSITIGTQLLPAVNAALKMFTPIIKAIMDFAKENPTLTKSVIYLTAALAGLLLVTSGVASVISAVSFASAAIIPMFSTIGMIVGSYIVPAFQVFWALCLSVVEVLAAAAGVTTGVFAAGLLLVVSIFYSIYHNWQKIVEAFSNGGILAGIKMIGVAILDSILYPLQKILELAGKLPGSVGAAARSAAASMEQFRGQLGAETDGNQAAKALNPKAEEQRALKETINTNNASVDINVNDPNNRVQSSVGFGAGLVNLTSTTGVR